MKRGRTERKQPSRRTASRKAAGPALSIAKILTPGAAQAINRPRLFRQLDRERAKPLTWISGPAGSGKTTLVASYLDARARRSVWYRVDDTDEDAATVFSYLAEACPARGRPLPLFTPEYQRGVASFARRYFRALFDRLPAPFVIVFDNYQDVSEHAALHQILQEAVEELPARGRMIVMSRHEPPAAFARLRASRAIGKLSWPELRLTRDEAVAIVRQLAGRRWPRGAVEALHATVDGWAAGLILLMDPADGDHRPASLPAAVGSSAVFDYFASEVFARTGPETQDVLLRTSLVPAVTVPIAVALSGRASAGEVLDRLHRHHYFTSRQQHAEPVYQYHPLFREFLIARARRNMSAADFCALQRSASRFVEQAGDPDAAATLLKDSADWRGLIDLIARQAVPLLTQGRSATIEDWMRALPDAMVSQQPWVLYWRGMCRLAWENAACQRDLASAFDLFRRHGEPAGVFLAWSALMLCYESDGNVAAMDHWIAMLDEILDDARALPEEIEMRVAGGILIAMVFRRPHYPDGARWARRAVKLAARSPDLSWRAVVAFNWHQYYMQFGEFATARVVVDEMRQLLNDPSSPASAVSASMTVVWEMCLNADPAYRTTATKALELAHDSGMLYNTRIGMLSAALFAALSDGDAGTAEGWLDAFEQDLSRVGLGFHGWYHQFRMRVALLRGDLAVAERERAAMLENSLAAGWRFDQAVDRLLSAYTLAERGAPIEAGVDVARAAEIARDLRSPYLDFMVRLAEADLAFRAGDEATGAQALEAAMRLGRTGGFVNTHAWMPAMMTRLLTKALESNIEVAYVKDLMSRRQLLPDVASIENEMSPWPVKIYTRGRFAVHVGDRPLRFAGKTPRRVLDLLKTIVALGGRGVSEDRLIDALWPDAEGDAARFALTTAVHRLRRVLERPDAVLRQGGEIGLNPHCCWMDVWAIEHLVARVNAAHRRGTTIPAPLLSAARRAADLCLAAEPSDESHGAHEDVWRRRVEQLLLSPT